MCSPIDFDILGSGAVAVDDLLYVDHYPLADSKGQVLRKARTFGGVIGTALAAACRLGRRCAYAGVLGDDDLSRAVKAALAGAGVDCRFIQHDPMARPVHSIVIIDDLAHTRNIFFDIAGVLPLPAEAITRRLIGSAKVLLIDHLWVDSNIRAAALARALGIPTVADMEIRDAKRASELMALVDHLILPYEFASAYTGLTEIRDILANLHQMHVRACTAVTLGSRGCYYISGGSNEVHQVPAFDISPVETIGCGDVFHGAYAAALAESKDVHQCLLYATAAAGTYASRPSGWQFLPTEEDVAPLLRGIIG
ncbi:MAG: hypothetical protein HQ546_00075 [Planctomycetes bacterium]|nr:hypothetical protein [Planctomycetota bacterium]